MDSCSDLSHRQPDSDRSPIVSPGNELFGLHQCTLGDMHLSTSRSAVYTPKEVEPEFSGVRSRRDDWTGSEPPDHYSSERGRYDERPMRSRYSHSPAGYTRSGHDFRTASTVYNASTCATAGRSPSSPTPRCLFKPFHCIGRLCQKCTKLCIAFSVWKPMI